MKRPRIELTDTTRVRLLGLIVLILHALYFYFFMAIGADIERHFPNLARWLF